MSGPLATECELDRTGEGIYERDCSKVWWGFQALHGGYVMALAQSAIAAEVSAHGGEEMGLHHCSLQYLRPFVDGPLRIEVTLERKGRTMANATARMWSGGKLAGLVLASFAIHRPVAEYRTATMPDVAPCGLPGSAEPSPTGLPVYDRFWLQPCIDEITGGEVARTGGWVSPRVDEVVDHRYVGLLVDLWMPVTYFVWAGEMHVAQSADLTYHARSALPRADLPPGSPLLLVLTTRASDGGFIDEDVEVWSPAGDLMAQSRQCRYVHS